MSERALLMRATDIRVGLPVGPTFSNAAVFHSHTPQPSSPQLKGNSVYSSFQDIWKTAATIKETSGKPSASINNPSSIHVYSEVNYSDRPSPR